MKKRIYLILAVSIGLVGALENPAHSGPLEEGAIMVLASEVCGVPVDNDRFLPMVRDFAIEADMNVLQSLNMIRTQAEVSLNKLVEQGEADNFCNRAAEGFGNVAR